LYFSMFTLSPGGRGWGEGEISEFFTPSLSKGGKDEIFQRASPKGSPPFEKWRPGGISGKAFSKR